MKKALYIIFTILLAVSTYIVGKEFNPRTITEVETVEIEKEVKTIPDGYIDTTTEEFYNNYLDMRTVINYVSTNDGILLHTEDGNGYYLEVPKGIHNQTNFKE